MIKCKLQTPVARASQEMSPVSFTVSTVSCSTICDRCNIYLSPSDTLEVPNNVLISKNNDLRN